METNHIRPTELCKKCNCKISVNNIKKHFNICDGKPSCAVRKSNNLKVEIQSSYKNGDLLNWEEIQKFYDDKHTFKDVQIKYKLSSHKLADFIKKGFLKTRTSHETMRLRGTFNIPKMTQEMRDKVSRGMRKAVLEGRQKTPKPYASRLTIYYHTSWLNNLETLHGGWELKTAKYMDEQKIHWIKSKDHFTYIFNEHPHEYFPDFYLSEYDLYLEVKGPIQPKDLEKWKQFPKKLLVIDKTSINDLNNFFKQNIFSLKNTCNS
jgi:hypothetical protein